MTIILGKVLDLDIGLSNYLTASFKNESTMYTNIELFMQTQHSGRILELLSAARKSKINPRLLK
jgi:hypothetical protein